MSAGITRGVCSVERSESVSTVNVTKRQAENEMNQVSKAWSFFGDSSEQEVSDGEGDRNSWKPRSKIRSLCWNNEYCKFNKSFRRPSLELIVKQLTMLNEEDQPLTPEFGSKKEVLEIDKLFIRGNNFSSTAATDNSMSCLNSPKLSDVSPLNREGSSQLKYGFKKYTKDYYTNETTLHKFNKQNSVHTPKTVTSLFRSNAGVLIFASLLLLLIGIYQEIVA